MAMGTPIFSRASFAAGRDMTRGPLAPTEDSTIAHASPLRLAW